MRYHRLTALLAGALFLLLTGCQSTPTRGDKASTPLVQDEHSYLRSWEAQGKISLQKGDDRTSASYRWRQLNQNYIIHLHGPFGQGATWLKRTTKGVTLENAEVGIVGAATAEELMQQVAGWQVPVSGLQYWITGMAVPGIPAEITAVGEDGLATAITQQGWTIEFGKRKIIEGRPTPTKIVATRDDIRVTVIVKDWDVPLDIYEL